MDIIVRPPATLVCLGKAYVCALGRAGVTAAKREADGATPVGCFPLRLAMYRADRMAAPVTRLPVRALTPDDGWCDDPRDPDYNRLVRLPHRARHERLWRDDGLYDLLVVLGCNDDPPVPGKGSAIFLHVARAGGEPTDGCVAMARADLLEILGGLGPDDRLCVTPTSR